MGIDWESEPNCRLISSWIAKWGLYVKSLNLPGILVRQFGFRGYYDGNSKKRVAFFRSAAYMFYAYVIRSLKFPLLYKGHCENIDERLKQHNSGMTKIYPTVYSFWISLQRGISITGGSDWARKVFQNRPGPKISKNKNYPTNSVVQCPPGWRQSDGDRI